MIAKLKKARKKLHPHDSRSSRYTAWKRNIATGMRKAKLKRRAAGLLTFTEVSVELALPVSAIRRLGLAVVDTGGRQYIRRSEVERWKRETGAAA
jgi:hypothetical protein